MSRSGHSNPVVATWKGDWRAHVTAGSFSFDVDEPESAGGSNTGPMPTEYFLGSLASCYVLALHYAASRKKVELPDLEVSAVGEYDGPRYRQITLTVSSTLPKPDLEPLLPVASKVCYVSNTLENEPLVEIAD